MHLFDEATALEPIGEDGLRFGGAAHPGFKNMIGPYGGWSAAILAKSMIEAAGPDMELTTLTTDFLAGASEGPITIDLECKRQGRNTQFWTADLVPGDSETPANCALGIMSRRRETLAWVEGHRPEAPEPEDCERFPLPMAWTKPVEMRGAANNPFQGGDGTTKSLAWVRLDPDRPLDPVSLVALADTPTPRLFFKTGKPDLIATVSMTVYLHATPDDYEAVGTDYLLVEATGARGGRGFNDQHATIWSRDGRLMATTQQMVSYRTKAAKP